MRQNQALLKDNSTDDSVVVGTNTSAKSCFLIPLACLSNEIIKKICEGYEKLMIYKCSLN